MEFGVFSKLVVQALIKRFYLNTYFSLCIMTLPCLALVLEITPLNDIRKHGTENISDKCDKYISERGR